MDVLYTDIVDVGGRIFRKQSASMQDVSAPPRGDAWRVLHYLPHQSTSAEYREG